MLKTQVQTSLNFLVISFFLLKKAAQLRLPVALAFMSFVLSVAMPVGASLYPTKPVANTVYTAGAPAQVVWMEDGKMPLLNGTYGVRIDLYAGNNTYVGTLARDLQALALNTTVYIPPNIPKNYRSYTLRFITSQPPQIIYTSSFAILPSPFSLAPPASSTTTGSHASNSGSGSHSGAVATTTVTSTVISRVAETGAADSTSTGTAKAKSQGGKVGWKFDGNSKVKGAKGKGRRRWIVNEEADVDVGGFGFGRGFGVGGGEVDIDLEKVKFRLVFIVWPALVGLSMAF